MTESERQLAELNKRLAAAQAELVTLRQERKHLEADAQRSQRETEGLLEGLRVLTQSIESGAMMRSMLEVLRKLLEFEHAFILLQQPGGLLVPIASTHDTFGNQLWRPGPFLRRILQGQTLVVSDVSMISEWGEAHLNVPVTSALHMHLTTSSSDALLVCTHSDRGFFTRKHVAIAERFSPIAVQTLGNAELMSQLREDQITLEQRVQERTEATERTARYTQTLFRATAQSSQPIHVQIQNALQISAEMLDMQLGSVNQTFGEHFVTTYVYDQSEFLHPGDLLDADSDFSREVVSDGTVFAIDCVSQSDFSTRSADILTPIESFIGAPIFVGGRSYGTLTFSSANTRSELWSEPEKAFVALLGRWIGQALERRQAENALRESEAEARKLSQVASRTDNLVVITDADGYIEWVNDAFTRVTGYSLEECFGSKPGQMLQGPATNLDTVAYMRAQLAMGRGFQCEVLNYSKDGIPYWIEIEVQPVHDEEGALANFIAVESDITERKNRQSTLVEAKESAEAANRAKSDFLASMSHELRTPLNAIIGLSGLLIDTELNYEQLEAAELIRRSGDNLLTIINDILDFSKIEAGKMELENQPFDLRQCVEEALDLFTFKASQKRLDLAYQFSAKVPSRVLGDITRLRQVLVNLLGNAIKFTTQGEIAVDVSFESLPNRMVRLQFDVRDTGIGIPQDRLNRLFRAFSQVDASTTRQYGGTGLGLAICARLCEMMGGRIWVNSVDGEGSTFSFTIEVETLNDQTYAYLNYPVPQMRGRRVMIVEDNRTNRTILEQQLTAWGIRVVPFDSARPALDSIARKEYYDAAILDIYMPGMDGITLSKEIKARMAHLPQVILSSASNSELSDANLDAQAYLSKPIKPAVLYNTLLNVLSSQDSATVASPTQNPRQSQFETTLGQRHPLRILLAEDNMINQRVAQRMLNKLGYRADIAGNGLEAINALERQVYDVVFMDIQMPEMDGVTATQEINRRLSIMTRPRIIAMTANALKGDREKYLASGMDDYISKPVRIDELTRVLRRTQPLSGATTRDTTASPPIEIDILQEQYGDLAEEMLFDLLPYFHEDARSMMSDIRSAVGTRTSTDIIAAAHALRGAAGSVAANTLVGLCLELENAARGNELDRTEGLTDQITAEIGRVASWQPDS